MSDKTPKLLTAAINGQQLIKERIGVAGRGEESRRKKIRDAESRLEKVDRTLGLVKFLSPGEGRRQDEGQNAQSSADIRRTVKRKRI